MNILDNYKSKYKDNILMGRTSEKQVLSTCSINLNNLLGGGIQKGKIVEIFGHEGSGKSTLCYSIIAKMMKKEKNKFACIIDTEGSICSYDYIKDLGISESNVLIMNISDGEKVFDVIDEMVQDKKCSIVVVDSVASILTEEDIEMGSSTIGSHARLICKRLRRVVGLMNEKNSDTIVVLINQLRSKINEMWKGEMNFTTTGGKALKYYTSLRLEIERYEFIKEKEERIGFYSKVKTVKSRFSIPFSSCTIPFIYGKGFSDALEKIDLLLNNNKIIKSGSWYYLENDGLKHSFRSKIEILRKIEDDSSFKETIDKLTK